MPILSAVKHVIDTDTQYQNIIDKLSGQNKFPSVFSRPRNYGRGQPPRGKNKTNAKQDIRLDYMLSHFFPVLVPPHVAASEQHPCDHRQGHRRDGNGSSRAAAAAAGRQLWRGRHLAQGGVLVGGGGVVVFLLDVEVVVIFLPDVEVLVVVAVRVPRLDVQVVVVVVVLFERWRRRRRRAFKYPPPASASCWFCGVRVGAQDDIPLMERYMVKNNRWGTDR